MTRTRIIVNLFAIAVIVYAAITLRARSRAQHDTASPADPLAILDCRVPMVDFAGASLPEAAETLSKAAGVRITIDPGAAKATKRENAIPFTIGGITLEESLRRLTALFDGLSYVVERDGIRITTSGRAPLVVRIYDMRDLRERIVEETPVVMLPTPPISLPGGFYGSTTGGPPTSMPSTQSRQTDAMRNLAWLIESSRPEEWWVGGGSGSAQYIGGFLVVLQSPAVHRHIPEMLATLRQADGVDASRSKP